MGSPRALAAVAAVAGVVLLVIAGVYIAEPAHSLPSWLPGHVGAGDAEYGHHHIKHGIAALAVALAAFAYAWFNTGPKATAASRA
jgi:drug/metabolite transporter (DMT)-like permease